MWGGHAWRACGAQAYNGAWGRNPSGVWEPGSGGKAPEAENLLAFGAQWKQQICFILHILSSFKP